MTTRLQLQLACAVLLLGVQACMFGGEPKRLSIDPERRGFEIRGRPVIVFFVDGLRQDVFEAVRASGKLPRLSRHLLDRAARVRSAVTSVPSVTYANAVSMVTGCWPSTHGVWANVCFDRDQLVTRNYEVDRARVDSDAASPMIFELLCGELTATVTLGFSRCVKIPIANSATTGGTAAWVNWFFERKQKADEILGEQLYEIGDQARRIGEWPAYALVHLPAVDSIGHESGSDGSDYRSAVENLDDSIGRILESFERGGMLEDLTLVLISDHGHHTTPISLDLNTFLPRALFRSVLVRHDNDADDSFLARFGRYTSTTVVCTETGEREASLHLCVHGRWSDRPSLEEILAFPEEPREVTSATTLPQRLLESPAVDIVVVRAGPGAVQVHGRSGSAAIERSLESGEPRFAYRVLSGKDPLGYGDDPELASWIRGGPHGSREWLTATAEQRHPDLVPQLVTAFDHRRSGDVILFAAPGWDFSEKYAGGHGAIEREEMIVPFYIAGPGIRAGAEIPAARLIDLVPTLVELTGMPVPAEQRFDGVSLARFLR